MKRWPLLLLSGALLVSLAAADDPPARLAGADRVRQFQQNYRLVKNLVESGLQLAAEEDPVKRTEYCSTVAQRLAAEMSEAIDKDDMTRVCELGQHLHDILEQGVTAGLRDVRHPLPQDSSAASALGQVRAQVQRLVDVLQERLQKADHARDSAACVQTLASLRQSLAGLDQSIQSQTSTNHP
jgi:hypothetical protein